MKKNLQFVGLIFSAVLVGCSTIDPVTGLQTRNMYSLDQDVGIGSKVYDQTLEEMRARGVPINEDRARVAQLQGMVNRISAASDLPDLPYEVSLIQTNIVNAMAAPGGKIMVYEGLWDPEKGLTKDDDEIAAVIAHEIAHVNARHSTEAMTRSLPVNILATVGVIAAKDTDYEQFAQIVAAGGLFLYNGIWMTRYSRENEMEADAVGMMYMAKAGYDPRAAIRIWERASQQRTGEDPAASIFSTHPPDAARLAALRARLPEALRIYQHQ
ncbi:M48 family metallopeptidase [Tichowtungia aerotolerans]|uniref:M48 family metalloprotease n=1 Tax=Tichowtungia aerotolerans TaxID=2697043 RepID=A0A6P1M8E0_9BACT|nr:M48 family metallopeptidase [Tichowtungia aerotolerans]QHI68398.1 M48 family metalloprotease [Tichowtungia aerotolerans]